MPRQSCETWPPAASHCSAATSSETCCATAAARWCCSYASYSRSSASSGDSSASHIPIDGSKYGMVPTERASDALANLNIERPKRECHDACLKNRAGLRPLTLRFCVLEPDRF